MTNNFDVEMNPARLERDLDEAYVRAQVARLVDVAFDRDATEHELTYLTDRLMNGRDTASDIVGLLFDADADRREMRIDGSGFGHNTNNLAGLSGATLVTEAFMNAFGRASAAAELSTWQTALTSGQISNTELVALLAESVEHVADGNDHVASSYPNGFQRKNGTSASETIHGGDKRNPLYGYKGNDTLYGGANSDILHGGEGNDTLYGGSGNDYFVWRRGLGNDTINDEIGNTTEEDTLQLPDVNPNEVKLTRSASGRDLLITIIPTGNVITVKNQFENVIRDKGIEAI